VNNSYPINFPALDPILEKRILKFVHHYQDVLLGKGYNTESDFDSIDNIRTDEYQTKTNIPRGYYRAIQLPEYFREAVGHTIYRHDIITNIYLQIMYTDDSSNEFNLAPHIDIDRRTSLIYNLVEDAAETHFHNLLVNDTNRNVYGQGEISEPVETRILEKGKWYVMNTKVPHSVTKITKTRIAITSNVPMDYFDFCNRFSNILILD